MEPSGDGPFLETRSPYTRRLLETHLDLELQSWILHGLPKPLEESLHFR